MYQGNGAEEEWQQAIKKHRSIRHPNIIQIWGTSISGNMHSTIFHGDLIPLAQILDLYNDSPIKTVYVYMCSTLDFIAADHSLRSGIA
ncbi:hypothetical protein DFH09DRAFT_1341825 [Mycena vulgaris]|nr:hypothetical protein DFH09DRAFT_1341825 [Mycena vulgaris]